MSNVKSVAVNPRKNRLVSLDALRGFDMLWIIGARAIADGFAEIRLPGFAVVADQLTHSKWNGFTFYDFIFPLFIFITGVSLVFSLQKRVLRGDDRGTIVKHILIRTAILFLLGIAYNGVDINRPLAEVRLMGVLQRSALCYFFASMFILYTKPCQQAVSVAGILAGYWVIMRFVPVPGFGAGVLTQEGNLAHYIDSLLLPGRLYSGSWDPEGLLSTIPAIATCLLGGLAGYWLQLTESTFGRKLDSLKRAKYLFFAGLALVAAGLVFSPIFPINKNLWTSTYVLLTGGLATMLLAVFHWAIDIRGYNKWSFPFVVIGMNSIFIYLAARFVPFDKVADWLVGSPYLGFLGSGQTLITAMAQLSLEGILLLWLYKRKTFIRI